MDFKSEFSHYRREAFELSAPTALLLPVIEESAISAMLSELDKLKASLIEDQVKLSESLKLLKNYEPYISEIDFEAAVKDEADAKIKAQEEFVKPQIAKLTKEYNRKIKDLTASFDTELEKN